MAENKITTPIPVREKGSRQEIKRRLAAVIAVDIVGYSALMAQAEEATHRRVGAEMDRLVRDIERSHGHIFSFAGDGLMAEFPSAVVALKCALNIQAESARRNARLTADTRIFFRIGINSGEIVVQDRRAGGNVVNVAARLEALAEPGGVFLSAAVYEQVNRTVHASFEPIGEHRLKNIREPVQIYAIRAESGIAALVAAPAPQEERGDYRPSLAVLPFRTLQRDQSDAYFSEGMVDDIIRVLGGLKDLLVVSRSSTIGFARMPLDMRRIGQALRVHYVLHGSVRREREALRIAVELSSARSGDVIWADHFDGQLADLFDLQDNISRRVVAAIAPQIRQRELGLALRKHPSSMTAYDLTLQALDLFYRIDRNSMLRALGLLEQALACDPDYAPAYSQIASLRMRSIGQGWAGDGTESTVLASASARKAIDRDPNDALALAIYGHLQSYLFKDYAVAGEYLERAIACCPSCAWGWAYSSLTHGYLGDTKAAIARAERAIRLSPVGPEAAWLQHYRSQAYYLDGDFDHAITLGKLSAAEAPANASNLRCLIASLVARGDTAEAQTFARHLMEAVPDFRLAPFRERTPLQGDARDTFLQRLRSAGVPD